VPATLQAVNTCAPFSRSLRALIPETAQSQGFPTQRTPHAREALLALLLLIVSNPNGLPGNLGRGAEWSIDRQEEADLQNTALPVSVCATDVRCVGCIIAGGESDRRTLDGPKCWLTSRLSCATFRVGQMPLLCLIWRDHGAGSPLHLGNQPLDSFRIDGVLKGKPNGLSAPGACPQR
jgi:hypothetical protein